MVYNESNQLTEAVLCDGRTTRKVCYTYDDDGNLVKEYSPTDNSLTTYQYTVEDRLEAVYTGNAYNRNLQMAAYDGDGNRVYQVNYNPEKDEDFSCYYRTYNNCDYDGTGIQLKVSGEVSPTEDSYLGNIREPLTLNRYNYCISNYLNYVDPSGKWVTGYEVACIRYYVMNNPKLIEKEEAIQIRVSFLSSLHELCNPNANVTYVLNYNYNNENYVNSVIRKAETKQEIQRCEKLYHELLKNLKPLDEKQLNAIMQFKAKYSVEEVLEIILRKDRTIGEIASKYGIKKSYIQATLFRELRCFDIFDEIADEMVQSRYNYYHVMEKAEKEENFNLEMVALTLIKEGKEEVGNINFETYDKKDLILMFARYNGTTDAVLKSYGEPVYEIFEVFSRYE